jgi:hypothetical protein
VARELPVSAWQPLRVREGALGPLVFEFAAVRVWGIRHRRPGPPSWLLIRRSLGNEPELKYYVSNADAETPLSSSSRRSASGASGTESPGRRPGC